MKNIKKLTSFLLVLVLCLSMVTAAFAESEGTLLWELNESGLLTISGSGVIAPFTSADDQPWAACREQITAVRFDTSAHIFAQLSEHLSDILFDLSVYDLSPVFRRKYDMIFTFPLRVC